MKWGSFYVVLVVCSVEARDLGLAERVWEFFPVFETLVLSLIAGICSGMTVGLMGVDEIALRLKLESGTDKEKKEAQRILPLLKDHHLLLVTLLLTNALASETMPIVINTVLGQVSAVLISVLLTFVFGEVIPQALCVGVYRVPLASFFAPLVRVLILLMFPVSYPIARVLDKVIGKTGEKLMNEEQLKIFFSLLVKDSEEVIDRRQVSLIHKGIDISVNGIEKVLVNKGRIFYLEGEMMIDEELLKEVGEKGFSRIPVRDGGSVIGMVFLKDFLGCEKKIVREMKMRKVLFMHKETSILQALYYFLRTGCHMGFATDANGSEIKGLITLKDTFKYLIQTNTINTKSLLQSSEAETSKENFFKRLLSKINKKDSLQHPEEFQLVRTSSCETDSTID